MSVESMLKPGCRKHTILIQQSKRCSCITNAKDIYCIIYVQHLNIFWCNAADFGSNLHSYTHIHLHVFPKFLKFVFIPFIVVSSVFSNFYKINPVLKHCNCTQNLLSYNVCAPHISPGPKHNLSITTLLYLSASMPYMFSDITGCMMSIFLRGIPSYQKGYQMMCFKNVEVQRENW